MGKLKNGVPERGTPARWSWGDRHIIEKPPLKKTKVSCLTCKHYEEEDKSCLLKPIGPGDGIDHWKKCKEFILDSDYDTYDNREIIRQTKGTSFFNQMIKKRERAETDNEKLAYKTEQKELLETDKNDSDNMMEKEQGGHKKEEPVSKIELVGPVYIHKTKGRCVIKQKNDKTVILQFENGKTQAFDYKTLVKNQLLTKEIQ